jgi:transposase-like protein
MRHLRSGKVCEEVMMTDEMISSTTALSREENRGLGRGGRMSRQRKMAAVLRLLRGEDLELVSRSLGVTAATLSGWRDEFLAGGEAALATRPTDAKVLEAERLKVKLGELMLERELLAEKIARLEAGRPLARRRSRR